jgi:hypothetical protein
MDEEIPVPFKQYFPMLSIGSYFWVVIAISAILFGFGGYLVGVRVNQLPSSVSTQQSSLTQQSSPSQTPNTSGDDHDTDYSTIGGYFITDTDSYDQLSISIDSVKNGVKTGLDTDYRYITKPQANITYPYLFQRLDPSKSYILSASACTTNPKTYALLCAKNIKIITCSGTLQGNNCVITGNGNVGQSSGEVDFSIKNGNNTAPTGD